jgi:predicted O-linked N-acetylglucosamine transferase (SPINDLY family)
MSGLEATMIKARNADSRGDFTEAERLYNAVLAKFPSNVRARKGLDEVSRNRALTQASTSAPPQPLLDRLVECYRQGQLTQVVAQAGMLLDSYPQAAFVHNLLGAACLTLGRNDQAECALRLAYARGVRMPAVLNNLAMAIAGQGRHEEALEFYREAIEADPGHAIARNNMANSLKECGRPEEALAAYSDAIALRSDYADAHSNQGLVLEALGRTTEARAAHARALALQPDHAPAHNNLGNTLTSLGDLDEAIACYEKALAIRPTYPEAWYNLGNIFKKQGRIAEAIVAYRRAKAGRPDYADASVEQSKAWALIAHFDEAIAGLDEALASEPGHVGALTHRPFYQMPICDWSAIDAWQKLGPSSDTAVGPFAALTFEDDPARQLRRSRAWAKSAFPCPPAALPAPPPSEDGRIRIGYFSADFHDHATSYLMAGMLREHDRSRFSIRAYSYGQVLEGQMRDFVRANVDGFHSIGETPDAAVVDLARGHGLDIAVDLKGYTQNGRTQLFARRLAPVQISWLGYPGTSGAEFIDYLIADPVVIPQHERKFYSENLLLLPDSYQPNDDQRTIAAESGTRASFSLPETGVVFCCFNQSYKITPREWTIWMRVLDRVPGSVLWLLDSHSSASQNLRREAEARGIGAERLIFAKHLPQAEHLGRIRHADLFLDTFNVNAHTTASDALWAGVPVVTKAGRQFAARVGASLLSAIGLPELVTGTEADYEALILALATEPARLAAIRTQLAENRLTHPLFDTALYTRRIEDAFAAAHERQVGGLPPAPIAIA